MTATLIEQQWKTTMLQKIKIQLESLTHPAQKKCLIEFGRIYRFA